MVRAGEVQQLLSCHSDDFFGRIFTQQRNIDALTVVVHKHSEIVRWFAGFKVFLASLAIVAWNIATAEITGYFLFAIDACIVPDLAIPNNTVNQATYLEEGCLSVLC